MPVENAKEVVQRYIDRNTSLTDWAGKTVSYNSDCEVYFDNNDLQNWSTDRNAIYFGYIYFPADTTVQETSMILLVTDDSGSIAAIDTTLFGVSQSFTPIIFNDVNPGPNSNVYFIGYKFVVS